MHKILDDRTKFMTCNQDTNLSNLTKFQRSLYYLNSKKALCSEIYSRIYPTSTTTPSLYGLPKLHKPGIPLRPILSSSGSFNHECARWLSQSLANLRQHPTNISDTFTFLSKISNHNFANQTMVSFDVKSLFTNIPLSFTLNLILESIYVDNTTEWNGLNKSRLLKLLSWSTKNTTFQFNNKFYKQLDGVAMGSPIGPLLADVMMNYVIDKAIERTPLDHQPKFFCRYVDDCFATFTNTSSIEIFLRNLNSVHSQIQFTKEVESHNSLAFLDVLIEKTDKGIKTSTYHKPTRTGHLTKFSSFSPLRYKRNLVNSLLHRSYSICNSYSQIDTEFRFIKNTLLRNEYPSGFIDKCIRQFLNKKFAPRTPFIQKKISKYFLFKLPYLGNISHHVEKELKEFIDQHLPDTMLRFVHVTKNLKQQLHFKDPQPQLLRSNVVYRLNCSCGSFYIGQTRRNLVKRLDEHQTSLNSEVCNHLQSNPNHRVDFNNPQILTSSPDKSKLLILESLCIQQLKPSLNLDSKSFPLRLFST